jgi:DNA-binding NarL/FixJ family response regulator
MIRSDTAYPTAMPQRPAPPRAAPGDATGRARGRSSPVRVLIVEDEFLVAAQMEDALSDAGFEIVGVAITADEAIALAAAGEPLLAIMDIRLAGERDGIDAALELFQKHDIRCVFASAHSDADARRRAAPAAPLGWLEKPYSMASLVAMVERAVDDIAK